jgi:hypothetical protein
MKLTPKERQLLELAKDVVEYSDSGHPIRDAIYQEDYSVEEFTATICELALKLAGEV